MSAARRLGVLAGALVLAALWAAPRFCAGAVRSDYVGSERCKECHKDKYDGWSPTFHATVVQDARKHPEAVLADFSKPGLPFTLDDVDYTIGGHWDQRFMKKIGDDFYVLPKLWNVQAMEWRPYNVWSWKKMPYSKYCKGCHVTGFDAASNTEVEHRIGCEACHGPGAAHARSEGKAPCVNPRKLPEDVRDMICAACHVRGQDATGNYFFPTSYLPGEDLGKVYVPLEKKDGETNREAVLRIFGKWKEDRTSNEKVRCDVCGIYGSDGRKEAKPKSAEDFCLGCHAFKDKLAQHTRHADPNSPMCLDCHVQQSKQAMNPQNLDIHSYGYFLVHADQCYDRRIEKTCAKCHAARGEEWARKHVEKWKQPVSVDH